MLAAPLLLLSVSLSAALACEDLVRPLARLDSGRLAGSWALVAGSLSHPPFLERFRQRDSAAVSFSGNSSDAHLSYTRSIRVEKRCLYQSFNITLDGSSFFYGGDDRRNLTAGFISTSCSDCLLMQLSWESGTRRHFYLFSRRRRLENSEMDEFRAQVECLNLPPPAVMDPAEELCPDRTVQDPAETGTG